jgi:hypothetical protein
MDPAMLGLFHPLEKYNNPTSLTVGTLCFMLLDLC